MIDFVGMDSNSQSTNTSMKTLKYTVIRSKSQYQEYCNILENFILEENRAIAMGNYYFTDLDGNEAKVEYTFGYKLIDGSLKIDLHHSSFPCL